MPVRITGGDFRGQIIDCPQGQKTRPTQSRLRQALFNSIQNKVNHSNFLDLFSGSGAFGIEALSRGASRVVFLEKDRSVLKFIEKNCNKLKIKIHDQAIIISGNIKDNWKKVLDFSPFDIVVADPPYHLNWELYLLEMAPWNQLLQPGGVFCLEWLPETAKSEILPPKFEISLGVELVKIREKFYGDTLLTHFEKVIAS